MVGAIDVVWESSRVRRKVSAGGLTETTVMTVGHFELIDVERSDMNRMNRALILRSALRPTLPRSSPMSNSPSEPEPFSGLSENTLVQRGDLPGTPLARLLSLLAYRRQKA